MTDHQTPLDVIRRRYPNALSTSDTVDAFLDLMQRRLGIKPRKIMLADSICSDDLNTIEYPKRAGLTGMSAFAHHVPVNGAVFVFHGPHIGVSKEGKTGVTLRPGQTHHSACCGAIRAAIDKMTDGGVVAGELAELDYQQNTIEQLLFADRDRIAGARCAMDESTEVMYSAIEKRIDVLAARTEYPCRYLVIMGGVLINCDHDVGSFCSFRRLACVDLTTGRREDWLDALLGSATQLPHRAAHNDSEIREARRVR